MEDLIIEAASTKTNGSRAKNEEWKAKAAAPGDWVSALLRGKGDGSSVLIEFRAGRKGAPMLVDALPFNTMAGEDAYLGVAPLASECWEVALQHRSGLEGERYDYRIRVVSTSDDGSHNVIIESAWIEAPNEAGDVLRIDTSGADPMTQLMASMVIKLFSANIQLTRAGGSLLRQASEGSAAGIQSQFAAVEKVKEMAMSLIDKEREFAVAEADSQEIAELGKTARKWMETGAEAKLAKEGVKAPPTPPTRKSAATSLYNSLTVAQLNELQKLLGQDQADMLVGLMERAQSLEEDQLQDLLAAQFANDVNSELKLMEIIEKVFNPNFVPATWAIWQRRTANVLINGPEDEPDKPAEEAVH